MDFKQAFKNTLIVLRVVDAHDGQLSLSNLAVLVVLVKLALAPQFSMTEIGALFIALMNYSGKKIINSKAEKEQEAFSESQDEVVQKLSELESKVSALSLAAGFKKMGG